MVFLGSLGLRSPKDPEKTWLQDENEKKRSDFPAP
jgi:hypothetical protein